MESEIEEDVDEYQRYRYRDPSMQNSTANNDPPSIWCSKRFCVAILLFLGYLMHGIVCQVTGHTIVSMTTNKSYIDENNHTITEPPVFNWKWEVVEMILNTFSTGFLFSMVGGFLAQKCGGARTLGTSMLLSGFIVSLYPFIVLTHFYVFLVFHGLVGLLQSFFLVSSAEIFACWIPKKERPVLMSCIISGMYVGAGIMHPLCTILAQKWYWSINFYVPGILCMIWSTIWLIVVRNEPLNDKQITEKECMYILRETGSSLNTRSIGQFTEIPESIRCWALFLCKFAFGWGSAFTLTHLPLNYVVDATHNRQDINEVYLILFIPGAISIFIIPLAGLLIDFWQSVSDTKSTTIHKIIIGVSYIIAAMVFFVFTQFTDYFSLTVAYLVVIKSILSYNQVILEMITVNLAPRHASLLSGLSLFWQSIAIVLAQTMIKLTVQNHKLEDWNLYFYSSAAILIFSALIFIFFGSSEPETWSMVRPRIRKRNNSLRQGPSRELMELSKHH